MMMRPLVAFTITLLALTAAASEKETDQAASIKEEEEPNAYAVGDRSLDELLEEQNSNQVIKEDPENNLANNLQSELDDEDLEDHEQNNAEKVGVSDFDGNEDDPENNIKYPSETELGDDDGSELKKDRSDAARENGNIVKENDSREAADVENREKKKIEDAEDRKSEMYPPTSSSDNSAFDPENVAESEREPSVLTSRNKDPLWRRSGGGWSSGRRASRGWGARRSSTWSTKRRGSSGWGSRRRSSSWTTRRRGSSGWGSRRRSSSWSARRRGSSGWGSRRRSSSRSARRRVFRAWGSRRRSSSRSARRRVFRAWGSRRRSSRSFTRQRRTAWRRRTTRRRTVSRRRTFSRRRTMSRRRKMSRRRTLSRRRTVRRRGKARRSSWFARRRRVSRNLKVRRGQVTFNSEGNNKKGSPYYSRKPHVPGKSSGVTLGRGYDMALKSVVQVVTDLLKAGVSKGLAKIFSKGAGLKGKSAREFLERNKLKNIEITEEQQKKLFEISYARQEAEAKRLTTKYYKTNWNSLHPKIQQILTDMKFRGDLHPTWKTAAQKALKAAVKENNLQKFKKVLSNRLYWEKVPMDRFDRRVKFLEQKSP